MRCLQTGTLLLCFISFWLSANDKIQLVSNEDLSPEITAKFTNWSANTLNAVELTLGPLPQPHLPIRLKTKFFASEPVPWGQVERDKYEVGDGLYLVVYRHARARQLRQDWTLYHEISHIYLPYLDYQSFWLSEGFATYMQNVIMLQNGIYSVPEFIDKLTAGLKRGKNNTLMASGPLNQVTNKMRKNRAFMRVYWSGAAFFIEADIKLQKQGKDLPGVIRRFSACCKSKIDTGRELVNQLDKINKKLLFAPQFNKYQKRHDFPKIKAQLLYQLAEHYKPINRFSP